MKRKTLVAAALLVPGAASFSFSQNPFSGRSSTSLKAENNVGKFLATAALVTTIVVAGPAFADEYGKETEAPTLFTGETVMVSYNCMCCLMSVGLLVCKHRP